MMKNYWGVSKLLMYSKKLKVFVFPLMIQMAFYTSNILGRIQKLNDYHVLSHITSKYNDLIENRDVYIEEFRIKNLIDEKCKVLDNELLHLIENNVGIIQTDIYKLYEPYMKDTVSLYLYNLDKQGVIKRTKKVELIH